MYKHLISERYKNPKIRDHLASQYVLGILHPLVRNRLEKLMGSEPQWWALVEQWQTRLVSIVPESDCLSNNESISAMVAPKNVWESINAAVSPVKKSTEVTLIERVKLFLFGFRPIPAMITFLFLFVLFSNVNMFIPTESIPRVVQTIKPVSFLAMMSSPDYKNNFTLVAYQGETPGESSLHMQSNLSMPKVKIDKAMVWFRNKDTQELVLLSSLKEINQVRYLSQVEWEGFKNSSELVVTLNSKRDSKVLYRGKCIELGNSKA